MDTNKQKFTIGRDRLCDLALADETVSARHAELTFIGDGKVLLTDCKSRNGTFRLLPNGSEVPVRQDLVSPLDRVRFGDVRLSVRELLDALRLKHPNFGADPRPPQPPPARQASQPRDLERCEVCGHHRSVGQTCPVCGR